MQNRQGDVLIVKVDAIPDGFKSRKPEKVILAYGEVTGHHHRFEGGNVTAFYKEPVDGESIVGGGAMLRGTRTDVDFITIHAGGASLVHEEHDAIHHEAGDYKIVRQREFDVMEGVRRVAD